VAEIRKTHVIVVGLIMAFGWGFNSAARGQSAIAFVPGIGAIPSGATMTVTPAVSADRRYVRLTVDAFFNSLNGFSTFNVPAAVSGGGFGGFGGGGFGGVGGGGFGGMNGVIGPGGFGGGGGMIPSSFVGQGGEYFAGPLPFGSGLADFGPPLGDPLNPNAAASTNAWPEGERAADQDGGIAVPASPRADDGHGVRAANQQLPRQRRTSARKSSRRRSSTAQRPRR